MQKFRDGVKPGNGHRKPGLRGQLHPPRPGAGDEPSDETLTSHSQQINRKVADLLAALSGPIL